MRLLFGTKERNVIKQNIKLQVLHFNEWDESRLKTKRILQINMFEKWRQATCTMARHEASVGMVGLWPNSLKVRTEHYIAWHCITMDGDFLVILVFCGKKESIFMNGALTSYRTLLSVYTCRSGPVHLLRFQTLSISGVLDWWMVGPARCAHF